MENNAKIKVAIDSNVFFCLVNFCNPSLDPDRLIHQMINERTLTTNKFKNTLIYKKPLLLQKGVLGVVVDGEYVVFTISKLFNYIETGVIEVCITPIVLEEVYTQQNYEFIKKYVTVLKIRPKDRQDFLLKRDKLVELYAKHKLLRKVYDRKRNIVHYHNDGVVKAEASLFGLNLLSYDFNHLIAKRNAMDKCNEEFGLIFKSNTGEMLSPQTLTPNEFIRYLKRNSDKTLYFENCAIDEYNKYCNQL